MQSLVVVNASRMLSAESEHDGGNDGGDGRDKQAVLNG